MYIAVNKTTILNNLTNTDCNNLHLTQSRIVNSKFSFVIGNGIAHVGQVRQSIFSHNDSLII